MHGDDHPFEKNCLLSVQEQKLPTLKTCDLK
jgi:hypothetical protein